MLANDRAFPLQNAQLAADGLVRDIEILREPQYRERAAGAELLDDFLLARGSLVNDRDSRPRSKTDA